MAKGSEAKVFVEQTIKNAFGDDYVGSDGKKLYVWAKDGGEKIQISIALTCPKTPYEPDGSVPVAQNGTSSSKIFNWSDDNDNIAAIPVQNTAPVMEVTEEEKNNLEALLAALGL